MNYPLHHIGILVYDAEPLLALFQSLNWKMAGKEYNRAYGVRTWFVRSGETAIEFIEPVENSSLENQLKKRGNHIHHMAFAVSNLAEAMSRLEEEGYRFIDENPVKGFEGCPVVFVHPLSAKGILMELIEEKS